MQKQEATILSAELPGFQLLVENLPPEEITPLMSDIHALVENTVRLYQGKINRYTGDTFLAIFRTGRTASKNALNAAVELKDQLESFISDRKLEQPLILKLGIASGKIIETDIGNKHKQQKTLMGEAVNNATCISRFAGERQILSDNKTLKGLKDDFEFQKLEPIPLKGGTETLPVFELLGRKRKKLYLKVSGERKIISEMVGRDREFEILSKRIQELKKGQGSIVSIVGKAGIGKSRLMAELRGQLDFKEIALFEGRALSTGKNLSFHPIIHILKSWAGITEEDSDELSYNKLYQSIQRIAADQHIEIFPFIATMMGLTLKESAAERIVGIEGESLEKLILKNLRDLLTKAAGVRPVIIVLEDLHWADASSIIFLKSLYKLVNDSPIVFINILRPGYENTSELIIKYLEENFTSNHSYIFIGSLLDQESKELMDNLLHKVSLPEKVSDLIIKKSDGNPFFIEEIIRSFIDEGIIEFENNTFRVTEKIEQVNIPETINDVILSRVDKLDEKTKELLKTASAIGRNFYFKVLEEAADTIGELDERLEYLKEVQLINEGEKKNEIEYLFKHALAQQATYDSILKESRKKLHLKIARSIEKVFADNLHEFYGTLAYHYEMAENYIKMEEYLLKAGEESLQSGAPHEARNFLAKGLDLFINKNENKQNKKKLGDYYYKLSLACHRGGMNTEAIEYIEKFQQLHNMDFPKKGIKLIVGLIWRFFNFIIALNFPKYYFRKTPTELDDAMIRLIIIKGQSMVTITPKRVLIEMLFFTNRLVSLDLAKTQLGTGMLIESSGVFFWTGISKSLGRKVIEIASQNTSKDRKVEWMKLCYVKIELKLFSCNFSADPNEDEIFDTGLKSGAFWETTTYLMFSCYIHIEKGNWERAKEIRKRLIETSDIFENDHSLVQYYRMSGIALMKFRRLEEAIQNSDKGMDMIARTGHEALLMLVQCSRIFALSLTNKLEEAEIYLKKAEKVALEKKRGVVFYSTFLNTKTYYLLEVLKKNAKESKQNKLKTELLKTTKDAVVYSKKYAGNLIEAYRLRGIALLKLNKPVKAFRYFKKAMELGIKSGGNLELSRTYFELGKFLSNPELKYSELNGQPANYYLDKAKTMFEEMDLQWDLEELNKFNQASTSRLE